MTETDVAAHAEPQSEQSDGHGGVSGIAASQHGLAGKDRQMAPYLRGTHGHGERDKAVGAAQQKEITILKTAF